VQRSLRADLKDYHALKIPHNSMDLRPGSSTMGERNHHNPTPVHRTPNTGDEIAVVSLDYENRQPSFSTRASQPDQTQLEQFHILRKPLDRRSWRHWTFLAYVRLVWCIVSTLPLSQESVIASVWLAARQRMNEVFVSGELGGAATETGKQRRVSPGRNWFEPQKRRAAGKKRKKKKQLTLRLLKTME